jgi:hypothetical protein
MLVLEIIKMLVMWKLYKILNHLYIILMESEEILNKTLIDLGITDVQEETIVKKKGRTKKKQLENTAAVNQEQNAKDENQKYYSTQLSIVISSGRSKELLGKTISIKEIESMSSEELEKLYKIYESNLAGRISNTITDSVIMIACKLLNRLLPIDNTNQLENDLKNDYLLVSELKNIGGYMSLKFGRIMGFLSAGLITMKHVDFSKSKKHTAEISEQKDNRPTDKQ